jgi:hypothetical protein
MNAVLDGTPKEPLPTKALVDGDTGEGVPEPTTEAPTSEAPVPTQPVPTQETQPTVPTVPDATEETDPAGPSTEGGPQNGVPAPGNGQVPGQGSTAARPTG